jgi:glycosidase
MADRFANGDTANDKGGLTGGPLSTGFDPTNEGFYHGGDLKGLTGKLDYIKGLGTTAIWLTPSFKNKAVQPLDNSAGYHGYWITDFTQIDPHLGTNQDLKDLIAGEKDCQNGMSTCLTVSMRKPSTPKSTQDL